MLTNILYSVVLVCLAALKATAKIGGTYPPLSTATISQMSPPSAPPPPAMQDGPIKLTERTQLKHFLPTDYWPRSEDGETLLTTFEHVRGEKKILAILVENAIRTATGILPPSKKDLKDIPEEMREFFGSDVEKFNTFIANIEPDRFVQEFIQDLKDRNVLNATLNTSKKYMKHSHTTSKKYDALRLTMSWDKPSAGVHFFGDEYLSNLRVVTRSNEIFHLPGVADPNEGKLNGARVLFLSLSYKDLKLLSHRIDLARKQLSLNPKQAGSSNKVAENIADSVKTCIMGVNQDLKPRCPDAGGEDSVDPSRVLSTISKRFTKPNIKLSPSGTASLLYSSSNPKSQGKAKRATDMEGGAKLPGHFFLAKSFVNGAFENDTMTLGIIGSNMGLSLIEPNADEIFWNQVESIAQATRILGKIAGPFGSTSDIELGIWSLSNAVGRLRGGTSRSDRNDAINHILQESIDIAAILTSTSLATAFPFATLAATEIISNPQSASALIKLTDERIAKLRQREQEIPRLDFNETRRLDSRYVSSANYGRLLHNTLAPVFPYVAANVEHSFKALRKHEELAGIVFPSRSVSYTGPCRLSFTLKLRPQSPPTEVASGCVKDGDCTNWNRIGEIVDPTPAHRDYVRWNSVVSSCQSNNFTQPACYWNSTGYVTYRSCKGRTVNELRGLSHYICKCDDAELPLVSAAPQKDNKVDFTKKITVYPDRTATEDNQDSAFFKCKPGSKYNQGSRVSQNPEIAYECEGATAIIQPPNESSVNQTMLFDLKDGDDTVFLPVNSTQRNFFRIGDGRKRFSSGAGSDIFELSGPCSDLRGKLDGGNGNGQDSLLLTPSCFTGHPVTIDFINGKVITATSAVHITSIENLKGRKGQKEHIIVSSTTSHVDSGGGSDGEPDVISIPDGVTSSTDITIIASGTTEIISTTGEGQIRILIDDTAGNNISTNVIVETDGIPSTGQISVLTVFRNLPFEQVKVQLMNPLTRSPEGNSVQSIVITSEVSGSTYRYNLMMPENHFTGIPPILSFAFQNNASDQSSYLSLTAAAFQDTVLYHNLTMRVNPARLSRQIKEGSKTAKNVFEVFSGSWELIGGSENDEFIIHVNEDNLTDWIIDGQGGKNFLRFNGTSAKLSHSELDMVTGSGFKGRLLAKNIHSVTLPQGLGFDLHCACETRRVNALGGSLTTRQRVTVKSFPEFCRNRSLEVLATGSVSVFIEEPITVPSHVFTTVVSSDISDQLLNFHAYVPASSGVAFSFLVKDYDWFQNEIQSGNIDGTSIVNLKLFNSKGDKINLQIRELPGIPENLDQLYTPSMYFRDPDLQSLGQICIERNSGSAKVVHILDHAANNSIVTRRQGFLELENVFYVLNGTNWRIIGGNRNDLIRIQTNQLNGSVIHGGNGENTIMFENVGSSENFTLSINLTMGKVLFGSQEVSTIHNVHHFLGRPDSPDAINVNCATKSVNGRGGHPNDSHDIINITMETSCLHDLIVYVPQFTVVNNIATRGRFTYLVTNFTNSSISFLSTDDNSQTLIFSQPLWEIIDAININLGTAELRIRLNKSDSLQYPLGDLRKGKFHNPIFKIVPDGSSVACQLEMTEEGNLHAAFHISKLLPGLLIRGLPVTVNSFIINVTDSTSRNILGEIHGSPTLTNNIFHIHNLAMPLKLLHGQGSPGSINQLQIFEDLLLNSVIIVDMNVENGYIKYTSSSKSKRETVSDLVSDMKNINTFVGRQYGFERVYPHCTTTSINHADSIIIRSNVYCDRNYNLVMGIGRKTSVTFTTQTERNNLGDSYSVEGVFHYKFTSPRSFDIQGGGQVEGTHIYYLPVVIDDLKSLNFSNDTQTFLYSVHPVKKLKGTQLIHCSHKMISDLNPEDQFYTQPRFVTKEGFHIQISRTGSIILTIGTEPSADYSHLSETDIRYRIVPTFLPIAQNLQITILSKLSSKVFLYVGHSSSSRDRNVIQNSVNQTSHLVSGGATNTIFHIVDLKHDVFIYPGFIPDKCNQSEEVPISSKQVIDLSSIVATLRAQIEFAEKKYVPTITTKDSDLILRIQGYEAIYPGKITIVDGVTCANKFKTLFNAHTVDFKKTEGPRDGSNSSDLDWSFFPHPVIVPKGHRIITYPADLEDNFTITYENAYMSKGSGGHPSETTIQDSANTSFKAYRNGSDLILSNVDSVLSWQEEHGPVEPVTSTTFTGFFGANGISEETGPPTSDPLSDSAYVTSTADTEKSKIIYVWAGTSYGTINLPGLSLVLSNGTAVETSDNNFPSKHSTDFEVDDNNTAPIVRPWLELFENVTNKHTELSESATTLVPTVTESKNQSVLVSPVLTGWPDFEFWAILTAAIIALVSLTLSFLWIVFKWRAALDIYSPQRCYKRDCILGNSSSSKLLPNTAISL